MPKISVVVSIGNSDDKLSQKDWYEFCNTTDYFIRLYAKQIHFYGHGLPNRPWQNATWIFDLDSENWKDTKLRFELSRLAERFNQDSIFWLSGIGEFLC